MFDMPVNVLQHDDGVVDDEADRERQRHEREVVQAVAELVHQREGPDDRDRQRERRDERRREIAQK